VVVNAETVLGYMTQAVRCQRLECAVCTWREHVLLKHCYPCTYKMLWCHNLMAMICIIQFTLFLSSPVVTIYTTRYNMQKFYVLPAQSMCVDLGTNSIYFPVQC
jgi:vancomycin permeability regulator SanA